MNVFFGCVNMTMCACTCACGIQKITVDEKYFPKTTPQKRVESVEKMQLDDDIKTALYIISKIDPISNSD